MPAKWVLDALQMTPEDWGRVPYDPATGKSPERDKLMEKARRIREEQQESESTETGRPRAATAGGDEELRKKVTDLERRVTELEQGNAPQKPQQ
jgi:hypothetical protein